VGDKKDLWVWHVKKYRIRSPQRETYGRPGLLWGNPWINEQQPQDAWRQVSAEAETVIT